MGIGFGTVLFLIFMILKLTSVINWSWWLVTLPLWGFPALMLVAMSVAAIVCKDGR